jgi:dTDP-4-dehydrorhamnose 3,5-epimerase
VVVTEARIPGVRTIDIEPRSDERGFFARTFCQEEMAAHGIDMRIVQANISWSRSRGTLRGLHYQVEPHGEPKIVRCTRGAIWDVVVDLRRDSPTYRQWVGVELTAANHRMVFIPRGLAHGFLTLTDDTELHYDMGASYVPAAARAIRWDDPAFGISWPFPPQVLSAADGGAALWAE